MKSRSTKGIIIKTTFLVLILFVAFIALYLRTKMPLFESLTITAGTIFYHFIMRLAVGGVIDGIFHNRIDYNRWLFRERKGEKKLYEALKVKKWKKLMPTYSPESFNPEKQGWAYILSASCQAEVVHAIIAVLSFLPIFMGTLFGAWPVFIITSIVAALMDLSFVAVQRYNRPRIRRMLTRRKQDE